MAGAGDAERSEEGRRRRCVEEAKARRALASLVSHDGEQWTYSGAATRLRWSVSQAAEVKVWRRCGCMWGVRGAVQLLLLLLVGSCQAVQLQYSMYM